MTGSTGQLSVKSESSVSSDEQSRPKKRRSRRRAKVVTRDVSTSTDSSTDSDPSSELLSSESSGGSQGGSEDDLVPGKVGVCVPRPTAEVPIYWRPLNGQSGAVETDLRDVLNKDMTSSLPPPRSGPEVEPGNAALNVRTVKVDAWEPTRTTRGIEDLGLHALVDLHMELERERKEMPGELVVPGKVSGLAVAMLMDSGASVSILSTALWEALHRQCPGLTMLSTDCSIRTVSGDLARVRGRVVLEVELGGQYYLHQFIVMDVEEDIILGIDFLRKYDVDCNWRKGVLILRGEEVQACRRYSTGDGRVRKLMVAERTVVSAFSQVIVDVRVQGGDPKGLPDWGMASPALKPMTAFGVMAGRALVDPKEDIIPIPVMNPGETTVVLPRRALLAFLIPIQQVGPPVTTMAPSESPPQSQEEAAKVSSPVVQKTGSDEGDSQCESQKTAETYVSSEELSSAEGTESLAETRRLAGNGRPERSQPTIAALRSTENQRVAAPWPPCRISPPPRSVLRENQTYSSRGTCDAFCLNCLANSAQAHEKARLSRPACALGPGLETETEHRGEESRESCFYPPGSAEGERSPSRSSSASDDLPDQFYQKRWSDLTDSESEHEAASQPPRPPPAERSAGGQPVDSLVNTLPHHVQTLYTDSVGYVAWEERPALASFLREYEGVFARHADDLGHTDVVQHHIDTGDSRPIKQAPRRVPLHKKRDIADEVNKMLRRGVIEPCDSPWASPIVLAGKKDGTVRFCVDFRRLNDVTRKDAYPLPRIEDNLDTLQGARYYSTLDLVSGFWQVEVAPEDRDKTAFCVGGGGLYRFLTMPFGLCNAPGTFQRLMEQTLRGLQWEIAVLYIDDIIVFSETVETHLERLGAVLDRLRLTGLKLKPAKCQLLRTKVEFLGHIVSQDGVEVEPGKIQRILDWPEPRDLTELRSFVGLCAYYRRFVPNFSTVCKPLFDLTKKGVPFQFGRAQKHAFQTMKRLLTSAPILGYPREEGQFILDCDASNIGIGAVLSQVQDGEEVVLYYASKTLNKAERNYCVTRRELLAIVTFVKQFHHYLYGAKFLVRTDHAALYWLLRKKDPEGQMARWIVFLQGYNLEVQHRPGVRHGNADALSRCMEGCRDLDALQLPYGDRLTLAEIKDMAVETVRRVTTRAKTKSKSVGTGPMQNEVADSQRNGNTTAKNLAQTTQTGTGGQAGDPRSPGVGAGRNGAQGEIPLTNPQGGTQDAALSESQTVDRPKPRPRGRPRKVPVSASRSDAENLPEAQRPAGKAPSQPEGRQQASRPTPKVVETASGSRPDLTSKVQTQETGPELSRGEMPRKAGRKGRAGSPHEGSQPEQAGSSGVKSGDQQPVEDQVADIDGQRAAGPDGPPVDQERLEQFYQEQLPTTWSDEAIAFLQDCDPDVARVKDWCREGQRPRWDSVACESAVSKTWWARFDQLRLSENGVLYLRWEAPRSKDPPWYRVVAVASMFKHILAELHDAKTAGHFGQKKTIERVKRCPFYWPGMAAFARRWVQNCVKCGARKGPQHSKRGPLQTYWVGTPMDRVSIDLLGPFRPRTTRGNSLILTVTDHYTRWVEAFPLRDGKAPEIARKVVDFVCRHGMPLEIHSDQGRNVDGEVMKEVCRIMGIRKTHTTPYHPQGNAITERENAVIKAALAAFVNKRLTDWDVHLPAVMMAMRSSVHRTLGVTPNSMVFGRECRVPLDAFVGPPPEVEYNVLPASEYAAQLAEALQQAHSIVTEHMRSHYAYQKKDYDRHVKAEDFEEGDAVWLRVYPTQVGQSKALKDPWDGPWIVTSKLSDVNYKIQMTPRGLAQVVHVNRLRPYFAEIVDPDIRKLQRNVLATYGKSD